MKRIRTLMFLMILAGVNAGAQENQPAQGQDYQMALGIRASSSDAIVNHSASFKYFFNPTLAAEGLLSFSDPLAIGALLAKHHPMNVQGLKWFYGGGLYFAFGSDHRFGLQGVLGLDYKLPTVPINFSIDWKPEMNLTKEFLFEPAVVALSARFTLK